MSEMLRRMTALGRHGALTRSMFGKPRGTRERSADRKEPVPGHYYPGTTEWFTVLDEPFVLDDYIEAVQMTSLSEELREAAITVVQEFGDATCIPALSEMLHEGTKERLSACAAHALATIGGTAAEASLWRALENACFSTPVREAALHGLLDLLTPDGWDNYTFMNPTRVPLAADVYERLAHVHGLSNDVSYALSCFDKEAA